MVKTTSWLGGNLDWEVVKVTTSFFVESTAHDEEDCPLVCPFEVGGSYEYNNKVVMCLNVTPRHSWTKWGEGLEDAQVKSWEVSWCWAVKLLVEATLDEEEGFQTSVDVPGTLMEVFWNLGSEPNLVKLLVVSESW